MTKKFFVTSDIHSYYNELIEALDNAGFDKDNPEHTLVVLGDLLDRGEQPIECLDFVNSLERKILIRGNHEDLLEECLNRCYFKSHDIHNGTDKTILALYKDADPNGELSTLDPEFWLKVRRNEKLRTYLDNLVDYYEVGDNIFVHGWLPIKYSYDPAYNRLPEIYRPTVISYDSDWRNADNESWKEARWLNGMSMWLKGIREPNKTIWCGHWSARWGNEYIHEEDSDEPFIDDGIVAMDSCCAMSHKLNVKVIECSKV